MFGFTIYLKTVFPHNGGKKKSAIAPSMKRFDSNSVLGFLLEREKVLRDTL